MRRNSLACAVVLSSVWAVPAWADENVMVVFDGSNSMWGQIDGTAKIEIARNAMGSLLGEWTEDRKVGLMAYGHRRRGGVVPLKENADAAVADGTPIDKMIVVRRIEDRLQVFARLKHLAMIAADCELPHPVQQGGTEAGLHAKRRRRLEQGPDAFPQGSGRRQWQHVAGCDESAVRSRTAIANVTLVDDVFIVAHQHDCRVLGKTFEVLQ